VHIHAISCCNSLAGHHYEMLLAWSGCKYKAFAGFGRKSNT